MSRQEAGSAGEGRQGRHRHPTRGAQPTGQAQAFQPQGLHRPAEGGARDRGDGRDPQPGQALGFRRAPFPPRGPGRPGPGQEGQAGQEDPQPRLPDPEGVIGDRLTPGKLCLPLLGIEQAPIATDGALPLALPGLVEGLDEVDAKLLPLRQGHDLVEEARLVDPRRQGALAHPARARPTNLTDEDLPARKGRDDLLAARLGMGDGRRHRGREVLPVRQQVDGDEIDGVGQFGMAQPELGHVGVGHRHRRRYRRPDLAQRGGQGRRGHLTPQQDLVADHHRAQDLGKAPRQVGGGVDLLATAGRVRPQPDAQHHLEPRLLGQFRDDVGPMIDPIGPDAGGAGRQMRQVLRDLPPLDLDVAHQGALLATEGGIREAGQRHLVPRQRRHGRRAPQGPPGQGDEQDRQAIQGQGEHQALHGQSS